ncbi:MAG: P1 family peptidase [Candidatus Eremiobacteraeota bacterium]|nr:P1 family peptidase [Candidatus Eremiobacteraeota bacterium]
MTVPSPRAASLAFALAAGLATLPAQARSPVPIGFYPPGPLDGITDVRGVRVGHVTKIAGSDVRTGATAIVPIDDVWEQRVAAATYILNGNGEMTGAHWVDESGFLEVPVVLTDTLDVGRADDGVVSWLIAHHPEIGVRDDVPLPVVAECDDQGINDIQGRWVRAEDIVALLDGARTGDFARGNVGAGTGMRAFRFAAGIGSSSRVLPAALGGYTLGVLVNANMESREKLRIDGVPVGRAFANELLPVFPRRTGYVEPRGRAQGGSIIIVVATDAPLDHTTLHEIAERAGFGLARTGSASTISSGDLFLAFSTTHRYPRAGGIAGPALESDDRRIDALFEATIEATESAIDDALFSAHTITGRNGVTYYNLPYDRVKPLLQR